jgi:fumarylacetoacetate (FAA) hydrolase
MNFGFDQLISYAAYSRVLHAGTIIGSGTFSNSDPGVGSACIAERRAIEMIEQSEPRTPFLRSGERVRLQMLDSEGRSIFGAIDQRYCAQQGLASEGPLSDRSNALSNPSREMR